MSTLEDNQNRLLAALGALEAKIAALKNTDSVHKDNQELQERVHKLQSQVSVLQQAGEETLKDLDLVLGQIADVAGENHG